MKRAFLFEYTQDELSELIKNAVREVLHEQISLPIANPPPASQDVEVLSPAQVCAMLHISRPTLTKYHKTGKLKGKKAGGKVFYKRSDVNKFLNNK